MMPVKSTAGTGNCRPATKISDRAGTAAGGSGSTGESCVCTPNSTPPEWSGSSKVDVALVTKLYAVPSKRSPAFE